MSNETHITIRGRLTSDPELRWTPAGHAVANFTIASNARKFDKAKNEWVDQTATFWRCSIWRDAAENVAESLSRGTAVIAYGEIRSREYDKDGEKRTVTELEVEAIGPDLRWHVARAAKADRAKANPSGASGADPWAAQATQGRAQTSPAQSPGWGRPADDEPPF